MKFKCSVVIMLPVQKVIELFENSDNLKEWQDGFVNTEHLNDEPCSIGAKSKMFY